MVILLLLVTIGDIFFSSMMPAFLTGLVASLLTCSTYFSTLGQIPLLIRDKDPRHINFPITVASLFNSVIWVSYAVLVNDIPFFTSQAIAIVVMSINLIFYMWALDAIKSEQIELMINFFKIAFPIGEEKDAEEQPLQLDSDLEARK